MSRDRVLRTGALTAVAVFVLASSLTGQQGRAALRNGLAAYRDVDLDAAQPLLQRGLDPEAGPTDSLWRDGVQALLDILLTERNRPDLARAWAHWAVRVAPDLQADPLRFVSAVIEVVDSARQTTRPTPSDSLVVTRWFWGSGDMTGSGSLVPTAPGVPAQSVRYLVVGVQALPAGGAQLPVGTYRVRAEADGYTSIDVEREVLPDVITEMEFHLKPALVALPDSVLPEESRSRALSAMQPLAVRRFGSPQACVTAARVGGRLLITTYRALRGAAAVNVVRGGQAVEAQVAAYDRPNDLAVLWIPGAPSDSLPLAASPADSGFAWSPATPDCQRVTLERARVTSWRDRPRGDLTLAPGLSETAAGGPLVNRQGTIVGALRTSGSAIPAPRFAAVLAAARAAVTTGQTRTLPDVGLAERQLFGSVAITTSLPAAQAAIRRIEDDEWPELAAQISLPHTFVGPEGRYELILMSQGVVRDTVEFTLRPEQADQLAVPQQVARGATAQMGAKKGGFPTILVVLGIAAAGGGAALAFMGGGGTGCPEGQTGTPPNCQSPGGANPGSIAIRIPFPVP